MSRILGCFRLQEPCLDLLYPIRIARSLQSQSARILYRKLAQDPCGGILYKIHVSGSLAKLKRQHLYTGTMFVVRTPAGSMTAGPLQDPCLRTLCKIYVSRSSQRSIPPDPCLCFHTRESPTRCASPDLCLSILICGPSAICARPISQDTLRDPCLRILCKIHASGPTTTFMSPHRCLSVLNCGSHMQDPCLWRPHLRPRYKVGPQVNLQVTRLIIILKKVNIKLC